MKSCTTLEATVQPAFDQHYNVGHLTSHGLSTPSNNHHNTFSLNLRSVYFVLLHLIAAVHDKNF